MMRKTLTITMVVVLVLAPMTFAFGTGLAAAQTQPYSVTVETPDDFNTDGNQTIEVIVRERSDGTGFLNPLIEVPIQAPLSLPPNAAENVYNGSGQQVPASVESSSFTSGDALALQPPDIEDGATRTYRFNVTASSPSSATITADVRPLFNEDRNVRNSTTANILGTGTIDVSVEDTTGSSVGSADALIDGQTQGQRVTVIEGDHQVSVQNLGPDYPDFTVDIGVSETQSVTFVERNDAQQIQPIAYTADDTSLVTDSTSQNTGGPETKVNTTVSYTFSKDSGQVVYEVQEPDVPVQGSQVTVGSGGTLVDSTATDGAAQFTINETGTTTQVDVEYEGYRLGDVNLDNSVDTDDAAAVASDVATGNSQVYADANDDGIVSPVDAMLIAQYADDSTGDPSGYGGGS